MALVLVLARLLPSRPKRFARIFRLPVTAVHTFRIHAIHCRLYTKSRDLVFTDNHIAGTVYIHPNNIFGFG